MVVCKFWLENRCKFGAECRFEHSKGGSGGLFGTNSNWHGGGGGGGGGQRVTFQNGFGNGVGGSGNQYKWVASQAQGQQQGESGLRPPLDAVNSLPLEMELWEKSKMWPFSCVAIEKDLPSLPDFQDTSPEEMRFEAYQCKVQGTTQSYIQKYHTLVSEFQNKRRQLQHMTMDLKQKLVKFVEDGRKNKMAPSSTSPLLGLPSQPQSGLFGSDTSSTPGLFGKAQASPSTFGGMSAPSASAPTGLFGSGFSGLGGSSSSQRSLFGGNSGDAAAQGSHFGGSSSGNSSGGAGALFGKPVANAFGGGNQNNNQQSSLLGPGPSAPPGLFGSPPGQGLFGSAATGAAGQSAASGAFGYGGAGGGQSAPNLFGSSAPAQPPPNLFGGGSGGTGLFGKPASGSASSQPSLLGPIPTSSQTSLFGAGGASMVQPQPFGSLQQTGSSSSSLLGDPPGQLAQSGAPNLFGKPSGLFGGAAPSPGGVEGNAGAGLFGKGQTGQGSNSAFTQRGEAAGAEPSSLFTPLSDLTESEKAAFEAKSFQLGKIPLRPPPRELLNV